MRIYIAATGVIFGLITLAHIWRMIVEGARVATSPSFIILTLLTTAICLWSVRLLWRRPTKF